MSSITYFIDFVHCLILKVIINSTTLYFRNRIGLHSQAKFAFTTYSFGHNRSNYSHPLGLGLGFTGSYHIFSLKTKTKEK